jgi:hypothetical protein
MFILVIELARRYELPVESLEFHCLSPRDYVLSLPDEATTVSVFNDGRPNQIPPFTVVCQWWSCFKGATGAALPNLVDVELGGVLMHVWELEMAEHLLDEWCWVSNLHLDTINHWIYAVFQLRAWCDWPELVTLAMDLIIVEPPVQAEESEQTKRTLNYPISIKVSPIIPASTDGALPPPPLGKDGRDHGGPCRRCRHR